MVRTHALMESVSANLQAFLQPIGIVLTEAQKRFLREGLLGLLEARCPVVTRIARKLLSRWGKFLSHLERLETNLNRQSDLDAKIKTALVGLWLPLICKNTPIILDLLDLAELLVKKID